MPPLDALRRRAAMPETSALGMAATWAALWLLRVAAALLLALPLLGLALLLL